MSALWPYDGSCDFTTLSNSGWAPQPINEFIFKVQSRCNLNCDYCYVYNLGDDSWKSAPSVMSEEVAGAAAVRIRRHAEAHGLRGVGISIHGGEPLLRGVEPIERFVTIVKSHLAQLEVEVSMQTNATLVTDDIAQRLHALDIHVGVSLDGDLEANSHRLDRRGRSSYRRVVAGIERLSRYPGLIQGGLAVIDLRNDPVSVYETVRNLGITSLDVLLPHSTWDALPDGKNGDRSLSAASPYGDWLKELYDHWSAQQDRIRLRIFDDILHLLLGGTYSFESLGLAPAQLVTIEANGDIELVDSIGFTYGGAAETGANVLRDDIDAVLRHPGVVCRQIGLEALPQVCRSCEVVDICGGGLISHRFDSESGFKNQTVYCSDMRSLIRHINTDLDQRIAILQEHRMSVGAQRG
ncbi:FxsB family cyclophane-forming radical SAM/SPASM peptide maturase [Mycolicibacterium tusciae]|uniref:FxsB family cyclophane-forming radical SAM/SPASM peptide maturase n=1 Tax=Mycolicibacterium tusciae TaxID=75922 RepID=UPI00024A47D1|nr:FxsB family cyclophane-forming radical SAM/SPASM peptide maturase [Mycolicibacterium tusciae]